MITTEKITNAQHRIKIIGVLVLNQRSLQTRNYSYTLNVVAIEKNNT